MQNKKVQQVQVQFMTATQAVLFIQVSRDTISAPMPILQNQS